MATADKPDESKSLVSDVQAWGRSSLPPMALATLVTALHGKPFHKLPMLVFTPMLLFASYLHMAGFKTDAAAISASWSGLYVLLAARRRPASLRHRFTTRGVVRLGAMGLGAANAVAGGYAYATGDREADKVEREERDRWGIVAGLQETKKK